MKEIKNAAFATEQQIRDYAKDKFINNDISLDDIKNEINTKFERTYSINAINRWAVSDEWQLEKERAKESKQALAVINKEKFSVKDATNETISKMEKTLSHLEDTYFTSEADPKIASVLLAGYEKILKLKTTKEVGEGSMDISIIVAKYNADVKKNPQMLESLKEDIINAELCE